MSSTTALPLYAAVTEALSGARYHGGDATAKFLTSLHDAGFEVVARFVTNAAPQIKAGLPFEQLHADETEALTMPIAPDLLPDASVEVAF